MKALLWYLISVIVIIGLAYWVSRKVGGAGLVPGRQSAALRIEPLAQLNVGKSERLLLVRLGSRCLLLGVTAGGISLLAELTEEEAAQWQAQTEGNPQSGGFAELLDGIQKRKKQG